MRSPEMSFDPAMFDDAYFAQYEQQLAETSVAEQASEALAGILLVKQDDGSSKSYEQMSQEIDTFFDNEWVRQDEALLSQLVTQYMHECRDHEFGNELMQKLEMGHADDGHTHTGAEAHTHQHEKEDGKSDKRKDKKKATFWWWPA